MGRRQVRAGLECDCRAFRQVMEPDVADITPAKRIALAVVAKQRADAAVPMKFCNGAGHRACRSAARAFLTCT